VGVPSAHTQKNTFEMMKWIRMWMPLKA